MNVNQRIIVANAAGISASKALSGSLPFSINGMIARAKNDEKCVQDCSRAKM